MELLLSVSFSLAEDIGMNSVRIAAQITQKLEVDFIPSWPFRPQLKNHKKFRKNQEDKKQE